MTPAKRLPQMTSIAMSVLVLVASGLIVSADDNTANASSQLRRFAFSQPHMGCLVRVVFYAKDEDIALRAATRAYQRVKQIDRRLSDYRENSELMTLCRTAGSGESVEVSDDLGRVLKRSHELSRLTEVAFDITVSPVVRLWRASRKGKTVPRESDLTHAKSLVGFKHVMLTSRKTTGEDALEVFEVTLAKPGLQLDLGGIAKGFVGDEVLTVLRDEFKISAAMVDAGGDIVVSDAPPGRDGWRIGVAALTDPKGQPRRIATIANSAIATSGDVFQFVEIDGVRYSHIIDPRTGMALRGRSSVTVIARDGMTADGMASSVSVLGAESGLMVVESQAGVEALFVHIDDQGSERIARSSGFRDEAFPTE